MDIREKQIPTGEQQTVLRALAMSASRVGCKFLEVGSWCGDSAVILGKVAQQNGGNLFCVDWWKGNIGTELAEIASKEDIFSFFWKRICSEGLEDVVISIRGRSDLAGEMLRPQTFDFVFIDGDHRYEEVLNDIHQYASLVRKGGILCGHDCEGRLTDYDGMFLESGKNADCYETVHCGVVLAVGSTFEDYSINHTIWSVRARGENKGWEPTNLVFPGIEDSRQPNPPPIGYTRNYVVKRYGRFVYAVPRFLHDYDITKGKNENHPEVVKSTTVEELLQLLHEEMLTGVPLLRESYKRYNFVEYGDRIFAVSQGLGPLDLTEISEADLKVYQETRQCFIGDTLDEAKRLVDQFVHEPEPIEHGDESQKRIREQSERMETRFETLQQEWSAQTRTIDNLGLRVSELQKNVLDLGLKVTLQAGEQSERMENRFETLQQEWSAQTRTIDNVGLQVNELQKNALDLGLKLTLQKGWKALQGGRFEEAQEEFDRVIASADQMHKRCSQEALRGRGWTYYQTGKFTEAIADFSRALDCVTPNDATSLSHILRGRAWAYYRSGRRSEALQDFNRAKGSFYASPRIATFVLTIQILGSRARQGLKRLYQAIFACFEP